VIALEDAGESSNTGFKRCLDASGECVSLAGDLQSKASVPLCTPKSALAPNRLMKLLDSSLLRHVPQPNAHPCGRMFACGTWRGARPSRRRRTLKLSFRAPRVILKASAPPGRRVCAWGGGMGLRQGNPQASLQASHFACLHGLVCPELLPQGLQLSAHPGRLLARTLYGRQSSRLHTRQPATASSGIPACAVERLP